jgi:thioredoxin-related protein
MSKVLDSINEEYPEKLLAEKIDISNNRVLAEEYSVRYVPHLLFIDAEGKVFKQEIGYMKEEDVITAFDNAGINIK